MHYQTGKISCLTKHPGWMWNVTDPEVKIWIWSRNVMTCMYTSACKVRTILQFKNNNMENNEFVWKFVVREESVKTCFEFEFSCLGHNRCHVLWKINRVVSDSSESPTLCNFSDSSPSHFWVTVLFQWGKFQMSSSNFLVTRLVTTLANRDFSYMSQNPHVEYVLLQT